MRLKKIKFDVLAAMDLEKPAGLFLGQEELIGAGAVLAACENAFRAVPWFQDSRHAAFAFSGNKEKMYILPHVLASFLPFGLALIRGKSSCDLLEVKIRWGFELHGLYRHYW